MATTVIQVRLNEAGTGLMLDDGHSNGPDITTHVKKADTVKWNLIPNSGITSLDAIQEIDGNVFTPDPTQQPDGSWQGVVSGNAGDSEIYCIHYTAGGIAYTQDPKIQVNV